MAHDEDYLEQLEESASISADDMRRLEHLACKGDVDERYRVAAICANCFETKEQARRAERTLLRLLKDQDKMVRVNACDSLCQSSSLRVAWRLLGLLADEEPLLRGYAAISLADISRKRSKCARGICRHAIARRYEKECDPWVQVCFDGACYALCDKVRLKGIVEKLTHRDHEVRYMALQVMAEEADLEDSSIRHILLQAAEKETEPYIRQRYENLLNVPHGGEE